MDVDRERPKKRLRIPRLHRTRKRRRNYVEVKDEDLIWTTWSERLPRVLLAWSFGFIGTFFLWLGLAIMYPIFADWPYTLLVLEIVVSSILAVTAWGRDTLMRKLADRGFVPTFIVQKILDWAYYLAFPLALYPYLSIKGAIPGVSPPLPIYSTLPLIALGLFFFMLTPHFIFLRFLWPIREARLSLLQFLRDWIGDDPRYFWLRVGMRGVETRLRFSGLAPNPGTLYHGASYSLFRENLTNNDLQLLAEWLIHPAHLQYIKSIISGLIWESDQAKASGLGRVHGIWGRILQLPWPQGYNLIIAVSAIVGSISGLIALMKQLGILH